MTSASSIMTVSRRLTFERLFARERLDARPFSAGEPMIGHLRRCTRWLCRSGPSSTRTCWLRSRSKERSRSRLYRPKRARKSTISSRRSNSRSGLCELFLKGVGSMSQAMTSFLRGSLASSCSFFFLLGILTILVLRPLSKTAWPFSKNSLGQPENWLG
jgi:hypothetical protein